MIGVRELARRYIHAALQAKHDAEEERGILAGAESLGPEDRALFQELTRGTLREWRFLERVVQHFAKRSPSALLREIIFVSGYQLLFLDRIPEYAVFSEAKKLCELHALSAPEQKFVHGVLRSIHKDKANLLETYSAALERLRAGIVPKAGEAPCDWAVMNAVPPLLDALTVAEDGVSKAEARARAVRALAAMKEKQALVGYVLPPAAGSEPVSIGETGLGSVIAPRAMAFRGGPELSKELKEGRVRVQGEASQWVCELAASELKAKSDSPGAKRPLRVLEMASGKGGKLIGTLAAWTALLPGGDPAGLPPLEWWAVDASAGQLEQLESGTIEVVRRLWPQVTVEARRWDWSEPLPASEAGQFDLVWLDAPCTGFGTLGKIPQIALTRGADAYGEAKRLSELQLRLSLSGSELLGPDGSFFYTVCTMTRPETCGVTDALAQRWGRTPRVTKALWPGSPPAPRAEGFFAAVF